MRGIHRSRVNSPHKGQWRGALIFFDFLRINGWVNNGEADDWRRHRAHYDVIVMIQQCGCCIENRGPLFDYSTNLRWFQWLQLSVCIVWKESNKADLKNNLTHGVRDKMASIPQTKLSKAFSGKKMLGVSIKISLKFVSKCPINNILPLVQIMAWCRPGEKPLSEPMMIILLTNVCVTRPQVVNVTMK